MKQLKDIKENIWKPWISISCSEFSLLVEVDKIMKYFLLVFVFTLVAAVFCCTPPPRLSGQPIYPRDDRARGYQDECKTDDDCPEPEKCHQSLSGGLIYADSRWPPKSVNWSRLQETKTMNLLKTPTYSKHIFF